MPKPKKSNKQPKPKRDTTNYSAAIDLSAVNKLEKDLRDASYIPSDEEAKHIVKIYCQLQKSRIVAGNQKSALRKRDNPHSLQGYLEQQLHILENQLKLKMGHYAKQKIGADWAMSQVGIGPIIAGCLLAFIDPDKCQTGTHLFKYAGLVPGQGRAKGKKLDYNPDLKKLCWLIGESFVKVSGKENSFYGQIYKKRKEYETEKNERLDYKDQAETTLKSKKWAKDSDAITYLSEGKLPPGHIHARAKRYAVKLFLSHLSQVIWEATHDEPWGMPYAIAHLGHVDYIPVPD